MGGQIKIKSLGVTVFHPTRLDFVDVVPEFVYVGQKTQVNLSGFLHLV